MGTGPPHRHKPAQGKVLIPKERDNLAKRLALGSVFFVREARRAATWQRKALAWVGAGWT